MKLLIDENIHRKIIVALKEANFSLVSIQESFSGMEDKDILNLSLNPPQVVITQDSDFGELIYKNNFRAFSVIYLRFVPVEILTIIPIIIEFLKQSTEENLKGKFVVLTVKKKRVTDLPK
jgi:predicted nuclease of predicted toxin-antitoxin system